MKVYFPILEHLWCPEILPITTRHWRQMKLSKTRKRKRNVNSFPFRIKPTPNILEEGTLCRESEKKSRFRIYWHTPTCLLIRLFGLVLPSVCSACESPGLVTMQPLMAWASDPACLTRSSNQALGAGPWITISAARI